MINEKNICSNPNCIWELKPKDVFCGLCGLATANIHIAIEINHDNGQKSYHPLLLDTKNNFEGLFFYHGSNIEQQQTLCFLNTGKRAVVIDLETISYSLDIDLDHSVIKRTQNHLRLQLNANYSSKFDWDSNYYNIIENATRVKIKLPSKQFASHENEVLKIKSVLYKSIKEIPLIDSEAPRWSLHIDQTYSIQPDSGKYEDIYPNSFDANYTWKCELKADNGAGILEKIELQQRNTKKSELQLISASDLPKTILGYQSKKFELSWIKNNQNQNPKKISLIFHIRNQQYIEFPLIVHTTPPISLKCDYMKEYDNPFVVVGSGINTSFKLKLENLGTAQAQLRNITIQNTNVKLVKSKTLLNENSHQEIDCSSQIMLPSQVQNAYLINNHLKGFIQNKEKLKSLSTDFSYKSLKGIERSEIAVSKIVEKIFKWQKSEEPFKIEKKSENVPTNSQKEDISYIKAFPILEYLEFQLFNLPNVTIEQSYTIDIRFLIQPIDSTGNSLGNLKEIKQSIDIPIAPVSQAEYILIDYGTVNTCVKIKKNKIKANSDVIKLDEGNKDHPEELKSIYLVKRFNANQIHDISFGFEVWESLADKIIATDWAAKLRLGTNEKRMLKDERNSIRFISGSDAATLFLKEVLNRVKKHAGAHFKTIYLSSPAAFNDASRKDLAKSLIDLGYIERTTEQQSSNQVDFKFLLTEPEAYLSHLLDDEKFSNELLNYSPIDLNERTNQNILGFVFDFGGGTTDISLFEFDAQVGVHIIHSFGYRWLGGEAITQHIAQIIYDQIPNKEKYPFPQIDIFKKSNIIDSLVDKTSNEIDNFGELRKIAEKVKCEDPSFDKEIEFFIKTINHGDNIRLETSKIKPVIEKELKKIIAIAINDIFFRIGKMFDAKHVCNSFAEIICMAGNSSRLWFMKDFILGMFKDNGVENPLYHFSAEFTKTGVVSGLESTLDESARRGLPPPIIKEVNPYWWYIKIGITCELILPAGASFFSSTDHSMPTDEDLDGGTSLIFLVSSEYVSLWQSEYAMEKSKSIEDASKFFTYWRVPIPKELRLKKLKATIRFLQKNPVLFFKTCDLKGNPNSKWMNIQAEYKISPVEEK